MNESDSGLLRPAGSDLQSQVILDKDMQHSFYSIERTSTGFLE